LLWAAPNVQKYQSIDRGRERGREVIKDEEKTGRTHVDRWRLG
jgi:hypothetical protein